MGTNFCPFADLVGGACAVVNAPTNYRMDFLVTFADKPGQTGVQNLLEVVATAHKGTSTGAVGGAFPMSDGVTSGNAVTDVGTISELAECSDRGLDNGDGECECFDG